MKFRYTFEPEDSDGQAPRRLKRKSQPKAAASFGWQYQLQGSFLVRCEQLDNGRYKSIPLANFHARIVRDFLLDDGERQGRIFELEAEFEGQRIVFSLSAAEFAGMRWVLNRLGPQAIIYPGQQQHVRAAIQYLSGDIRREKIFGHLGWIKEGPDWLYLHAAGALGAADPLPGFTLQLPAALQTYKLLAAASRDGLIRAIRDSLSCLSVAPDRITFPLLAAVYRAPLGNMDFSVFLAGRTGVFKTALAALCQQHFGAELDSAHLPASFASTAQAIQALAFQAKDALLVVDDFVPTGTHSDDTLQNVAEQLFRSAGNHQARSRMNGSGRPSVPRPPRALLLGTGEQVPRGQSIRARLLMIEVERGDVNRPVLSDCQVAAEAGMFAASMSGFLVWVAERYDALQNRLETRVRELRNQEYGTRIHARLPGALAQLQAAWEIFLDFALQTGAVDANEQHSLTVRNEQALAELALLQVKYQNADPASRFLALLESALASGRAHMADRHGKAPANPGIRGWRRPARGHWTPSGVRIGWIVGNDVFLDPKSSYEVARQIAGLEPMELSQQALFRRLHERGFLLSVDLGRQMVQVRRTLDRKTRQVLHLKAGDLARSSRSPES